MRDRLTDDRQTRRPFHKTLTFTVCEPNEVRFTRVDGTNNGYVLFVAQLIRTFEPKIKYS